MGLKFGTDRNGDAGLGFLTALGTVHPVAEGADAGGERGEGQVVVVPLSKQGHHVSELRVVDHAVVGRTEDVVGHLPHLRKESGIDHKFPRAGSGSAFTGPYQWEQEVVDGPVVEAFWLRDAIVVLGRKPARERCVGGSESRVLSGTKQEKLGF